MTVLFIAGALFGAIVGFWIAVAFETPVLFFGTVIAATVLGGMLSARFGVRFWEALQHWRWFWW